MMSISETGRRMGLIKILVVVLVLSNLFLFISHSKDGVGFMEMTRLTSSRRTQVVDAAYALNAIDGVQDFSSCLIVPQKDLTKLPEWLAYHYYALQTRYVVVLPDPEIGESVTAMLEQWKPLMSVVTFTEQNLMDAQDITRTVVRRDTEDDATYQSRREASFYHNCASHMQSNGRAMVSFHKVNEYATINVQAVTNAPTLMKEPGAVWRLLQFALQSSKLTDSSCVPTYQTQFSNAPANMEEMQADTPEMLHGLQLDTLQWRRQTSSSSSNAMGTAFVNVSLLPADRRTLSVTQYGTIRGRFEFAPYCPATTPETKAVFRMHAYPHTDDTANTSTTEPDVLNDSLTPWLQGFVNQVGPEQAQSLLRSDTGTVLAAERPMLRTRR